jgi:hypothetical protein
MRERQTAHTGETMTSAVNTKSGKGVVDGVISELATFWNVRPGDEDELAAACRRFTETVRHLDPEKAVHTGLRDTRHVIFDDGRRLLWATTFETDWDVYIDDAILAVGIANFLDWMQHTTQGEAVQAWVESAGGVEKLDPNDPEITQTVRRTSGRLKEIIQSAQIPAAAYFNALAPLTLTQVNKAQGLEQAFQQVLDDPAAGEALQHPALKLLLEQAAD